MTTQGFVVSHANNAAFERAACGPFLSTVISESGTRPPEESLPTSSGRQQARRSRASLTFTKRAFNSYTC